MNPIRHLASEARRRTRNALFGNNHSVLVNLRYAAYEKIARSRWQPRRKPTENEQARAARFMRNGFEVLPPSPHMRATDLTALKEKVDRLFAKQNGGFDVGGGLYRLVDGLEQLPEIVEFIDSELEGVVESYYRSNFKIFAISFYRTIHTQYRPDSSFLWHLDNCPHQEIKLMIYLDDVAEDTGALKLKDKPLTTAIRARGFSDRRRVESFQPELDNDATTNMIEGGIGTRILFENGGCIHKATSPRRDHRDVVTFVLIPSDISWRAHFARHRNLLSTNAGICLDPFTDKPENIGYQY